VTFANGTSANLRENTKFPVVLRAGYNYDSTPIRLRFKFDCFSMLFDCIRLPLGSRTGVECEPNRVDFKVESRNVSYRLSAGRVKLVR